MSSARPPELVATTMEAVCILMGAAKKPTWGEAKALIGKTDFLDRCGPFLWDRHWPAAATMASELLVLVPA
jgi:hypothetical protein